MESCEEPLEPTAIGYDDLLVVEGVLNDNLEQQRIELRRTNKLNESRFKPETDAQVSIHVSDGSVQEFIEEEPGIYKSLNPFGADFSHTYRLYIKTNQGREYESEHVPLTAASPIDSLWGEFQEDSRTPRGQGIFTFYFDNKNAGGEVQYYRWEWEEVFKIKLSFPSRWKWLGGDEFEYRNESTYETQEEYCFITEKNTSLLLGSSENAGMQLVRFPIHTVTTDSRKLVLRYSFELTQYGMSSRAREYWEDLARISSNQGSLFDEQPGTLVGNMHSLTDPTEIVLGIFEVSQKSSRKIFYYPSDFYEQGLVILEYNWVDCLSEDLISPGFGTQGAFMQQYNKTYELQDFYDCCGPKFVLKECGLCTRYGSNITPEGWVD